MTGRARVFLLLLLGLAALVVVVVLPGAVQAPPADLLVVTATAALLLFSPLTLNRRGRAARMTFGETAALLAYAALPPPAATVALSGAALVLCLTLRSPPANRAFNAASATVAAGAGALAVHLASGQGAGPLLAAALGAAVLGTSSHLNVLVVLGLAARRVPEGAARGLLPLALSEAGGIALGLVLAPLVVPDPADAWRLLPLLAVLAVTSRRAATQGAARDLLDALVTATAALHASLRREDVLRTLHAQADRLLPGGRVALQPLPPGPEQVGVLVGSGEPGSTGDAEDLWLVASAALPQVDVPTERRVLESLGGAARSALGNAALHAGVDEQTRRDPLTGLPNRLALVAHLERELARCRRQGVSTALLFLDLDGFKAVNDREGHAAGDALLVRFGQALTAAVRRSDLVARLAGDEFCVVLHDVEDREDAAQAAAALRAEVLDCLAQRGVGISVGLALGPEDGEDPVRLLQAADLAMYADKGRR